jgi:hypothetical protein
MNPVEIRIPETTGRRLKEAARKLGLTPEELARVSLEEKLDRLDEDFNAAAQYVMAKNRELYRRLA